MSSWNNLSIAQRSQLMNLFRRNGITSLSDMRRMYDLFSVEPTQELPLQTAPVYANGGDKQTLNNPNYNAEHERAMYDRLHRSGLNHAQTSGLLGNLSVESYLKADLKQKRGPAYGLMQAEGARQKAMKNHPYTYEFGSGLTPEEQKQLDYIIEKGMQTNTSGEWRYGKGYNSAKSARQGFLSTDDVRKATSIVQNNYLRPGKPHSERRQAMGEYYYDKYTDTFPYNMEDFEVPYAEYSSGGGIHIKPSRKGTFTAAATKHGMGVQEFASKVLANKDDYSPKMVKKAAFAKAATKFKHSYGGIKF